MTYVFGYIYSIEFWRCEKVMTLTNFRMVKVRLQDLRLYEKCIYSILRITFSIISKSTQVGAYADNVVIVGRRRNTVIE